MTHCWVWYSSNSCNNPYSRHRGDPSMSTLSKHQGFLFQGSFYQLAAPEASSRASFLVRGSRFLFGHAALFLPPTEPLNLTQVGAQHC